MVTELGASRRWRWEVEGESGPGEEAVEDVGAVLQLLEAVADEGLGCSRTTLARFARLRLT
jgi:hypothetical protein